MKMYGLIGSKKKFLLAKRTEQVITILLILLAFAGCFAIIWVCYVVLQINSI